MKNDKKAGPPPMLLSGQQVAAQLGVARSTVTRWVQRGELPKPVTQHGHIARWAAADVRRFAEGQQ